jgi:large subunit ribosomal protein L4
MYRAAVQSIYSELIRGNRLTCFDKIEVNSPKTKDFITKFKEYDFKKSLIIVSAEELTENFYLASRNVKNITVCNVQQANPVSLIRFEKVIMTKSALKQVEEHLK